MTHNSRIKSLTEYRWNEGSYYGKKTKIYFRKLDKLLMKLFNEALNDNQTITPELLDRILKITGRQNTLAHTITKLVETLDTNQRLQDIERLINSIPPDAIAKARTLEQPITN